MCMNESGALCVCMIYIYILIHLADAPTTTEGSCYLWKKTDIYGFNVCASQRVKQAGRTQDSLLLELRLLLLVL